MSLTFVGYAPPQESARPEFDQRRSVPTQLDFEGLEELQSVLGYGTSCSAINSIEIELLGGIGRQQSGRVEGMAPMDLLGEFRRKVTVGDVIPLRLHSDLLGLRADTFGLVHWGRCIGARWLAGIFLRERLPAKFLTHTWMDMRRELRFPSRVQLQIRMGRESDRRDAMVLDYSRSGTRLESTTRPSVGQRIELFDDELLAVGQVRFVRPGSRPQLYEIGCEFPNNAGIRISQRAVSLLESQPENWLNAESWCAPALCS